MRIIAAIMAGLSLAFGVLHFVRFRIPLGINAGYAMLLRLAAAALAPLWAACGGAAAILGLRQGRPAVTSAGIAGLAASGQFIVRVRRAAAPYSTPTPIRSAGVEHQRNVVIYTTRLPACAGQGDRPVYADLWLPGRGTPRSGIGIVYLHGSAWYLGDKGQMTDPLFRMLASQGHVALDVAYRMCPETDLRGMIGDTQAAVAFMQDHGAAYGVNPRRIVLSGTSAGGHIALVTAYTLDRSDLVSPALAGRPLHVAGVFTISAPIDMAAMLEYHPTLRASAHPEPGAAFDPLSDRDPVVPPGPHATRSAWRIWDRAQFRRLDGLLRDLLGGGPEDVPAMFDLAAVQTHVRPGLPPTLLIQGDQDMLVPVEPARDLYRRLREAGVRADYLELPQTDHGFDLALPQVSLPAQAAWSAIRSFLATL